ncbi:MAG: hypothetical protein ACOCSL_05750 [Thermoplasmatota archaeon]
MAVITITTDGTIENTKLMVDGKDLTKENKVVGIDFYAIAPWKSKYSDELYKGVVRVSYSHKDEEDVVKTESYYQSNENNPSGIGQKMITNKDEVLSFVGKPINDSISSIIDEIMDHCKSNQIPCPSRNVLITRTKESLLDKAEDLGLELQDAETYYAVKASETEGNEPKYPINSCKDVKDAWKLRSHAKGLKISQETLEKRIKRRAKQLGCEIPGEKKED